MSGDTAGCVRRSDDVEGSIYYEDTVTGKMLIDEIRLQAGENPAHLYGLHDHNGIIHVTNKLPDIPNAVPVRPGPTNL